VIFKPLYCWVARKTYIILATALDMRKLKHRLALATVALTFTPATLLQLVLTGNSAAISLAAAAAVLAGCVFVLTAVHIMENHKW
jgi:hypothetical protein